MWGYPRSGFLLGLLFSTATGVPTSSPPASAGASTVSTSSSSSRPSQPVALLQAGGGSNSTEQVDFSWHASGRTPYNDLADVVGGGSGVPKFTFDPSGDWTDGEMNWCSMPHVRRAEYVVLSPRDEYELAYVELMHRHHKRTPYAANAFPVESYRWNCDGQGLFYYGQAVASGGDSSGRDAARTFWQLEVSAVNPVVPSGWIGTCQFPQITVGGLQDSWRHGRDLYGVYHDLLGFLPDRNDDAWRDAVRYRVTQNVITSQVAGMVVNAMWDTTEAVPLTVQAAGVDGLEPQYSCPAASSAFTQIQNPATSANWAAHLSAAAPLYATLDDISGVPTTDAGFHKSLDHYYDNLSARQCHAKPLPCKLVQSSSGGGGGLANDTSRCVNQTLADEVYRFGHWEYAHVYRGQAESLGASVASIGVWVAELAAHLRVAAGGCSGGEKGRSDDECGVKYRHNVAHDGSVSRLLSVLQIEEMVWPGMGAEVVFEMWRKRSSSSSSLSSSSSPHFVRVLFGGKVLKSASPSLGVMDRIPLGRLLAYFDGLVGERASLILGKCDGSVPLL